MILEGERILLKSLSLNELIDLYNNEEINDISINQKYLEINPMFIKAVEMKINKMKDLEESLHPWYTYWMIIDRGMGFIGFKGIENKEAEVGYGISSVFEGKGYMTEALKAILEWAFESCIKVTAKGVLKSNIGSQKVLERNMFTIVFESGTTIDYERIKKGD